MIVSNLYEKVLINPSRYGHEDLFIVSGYASATFLRKHLLDLESSSPRSRINLIVGMNQKRRDHSAYLNLLKSNPDRFKGYYFSGKPEVHSKVYCWTGGGRPPVGFSGSANYSQYGFFNDRQQNQMVEDRPEDILDYYSDLVNDSTPIEDYSLGLDEGVDDGVNDLNIIDSILPGSIEWVVPNQSVRISLLDRQGRLPGRSGLNWGQRPEQNRDPDQAYLSIKGDARTEGFLPEKKFTFTLVTDDSVTMDCTVQQDGRKAISTTNDNSILGLYFRQRLGLRSGEFITEKHLEQYGRSDFLLRKLDDETFYLDFKPPTGTP